MSRRMESVNALLRQEISRVLAGELKDPRLSSMVSVTHVDTSKDLRHAKVFVSVLANPSEKQNTLRALKSAAGFIHRSIRRSLPFKATPSLQFYLDESIERGAEMLKLMKETYPGPEMPEQESS